MFPIRCWGTTKDSLKKNLKHFFHKVIPVEDSIWHRPSTYLLPVIGQGQRMAKQLWERVFGPQLQAGAT